ncbi:hypothetical protein ACNKHQ_00610 [Shigella flexneri]
MVRRSAPGGRGKGRGQIRNGDQTLASITFQNYFRLYDKLAGVTGTAVPKLFEFRRIYGLDTVGHPTDEPMGVRTWVISST